MLISILQMIYVRVYVVRPPKNKVCVREYCARAGVRFGDKKNNWHKTSKQLFNFRF